MKKRIWIVLLSIFITFCFLTLSSFTVLCLRINPQSISEENRIEYSLQNLNNIVKIMQKDYLAGPPGEFLAYLFGLFLSFIFWLATHLS